MKSMIKSHCKKRKLTKTTLENNFKLGFFKLKNSTLQFETGVQIPVFFNDFTKIIKFYIKRIIDISFCKFT